MIAGNLRKNIRAVSFDCYGTLIDWDSGVTAFYDAWTGDRTTAPQASDFLAAFARAQRQHQQASPHKSYRQVLADGFADASGELGIAFSDADVASFASSAGTWPPFPDTIAALRALKDMGLHLAVISNVDDASFAETHTRLENLIDTVVTAEMAGAYKPDLAMFDALFAALGAKGIARGELLHSAQSRYHDIAPAAELGLDAVWIDRRHGRTGSGITVASDAEPIARYESLAEFVADLASAGC